MKVYVVHVCVCVCVCMYMCVPHECKSLKQADEGIRFFGTGAIDDWGLP